MTWTKLDDGIFAHPKMMEAAEVAAYEATDEYKRAVARRAEMERVDASAAAWAKAMRENDKHFAEVTVYG